MAGKTAYNVGSIKPGVAEVIDANTIAVHGSFHRSNEWSSEPWTAEEKQDWLMRNLERANQAAADTERAMAAYRERKRLRKQFTGR